MSKLEEMLRYVSEHNEFYKNIIKEYKITDPTDISQYPILTRQKLQENRYNLFSEGAYEKYYMQRLIHFKSSGSSGMPVDIYWDLNDYNESMIETWRLRKRYHNISPISRKISFKYINNEPVSEPKKMHYIKNNEMHICKSCLNEETNAPIICDLINTFSPDWLYIQPSTLNRILDFYEKCNKTPVETIRYIECFGEILTNTLRKRAHKIFGFPITNMYGSTEMNSIAYEVDHNMIISQNVYVEVLTEHGIFDSGEGNAIVTNLCNRAMPLIRYSQGDIITISKKESCNKKTIDINKGRTRDFIRIGNKDFNVSLLILICERTNNAISNIIEEYYFVYHAKSVIVTFHLKLQEQYKAWRTKVISLLREFWILYEMNVELNVVFYNSYYVESYSNKNHLLKIEDN